jgi:hypothetical protein
MTNDQATQFKEVVQMWKKKKTQTVKNDQLTVKVHELNTNRENVSLVLTEKHEVCAKMKPKNLENKKTTSKGHHSKPSEEMKTL